MIVITGGARELLSLSEGNSRSLASGGGLMMTTLFYDLITDYCLPTTEYGLVTSYITRRCEGHHCRREANAR